MCAAHGIFIPITSNYSEQWDCWTPSQNTSWWAFPDSGQD